MQSHGKSGTFSRVRLCWITRRNPWLTISRDILIFEIYVVIMQRDCHVIYHILYSVLLCCVWVLICPTCSFSDHIQFSRKLIQEKYFRCLDLLGFYQCTMNYHNLSINYFKTQIGLQYK